MKRAALGVLLAALSAGIAFAGRPLATDDAATVEKGQFEFEPSFDYVHNRPDGTSNSPAITLKHGLTDRMDIGIEFGHETDKDGDGHTVAWGMSPLAIVMKMALFRDTMSLPNISLSATATSGNSEYGLNLIASKAYGNLGLHGNLGYEASGQAMVRGEIDGGLAAEYTLLKKYRVCAELNSELSDDLKHVNSNSGLIGGSVDLGFATWDIGGRLFDKRGPRWQATTGLTMTF